MNLVTYNACLECLSLIYIIFKKRKKDELLLHRNSRKYE